MTNFFIEQQPDALAAGYSWLTQITRTYENEYRTRLRDEPIVSFVATYTVKSSEVERVLSEIDQSSCKLGDWRYAQRAVVLDSNVDLVLTTSNVYTLSVGREAAVLTKSGDVFTSVVTDISGANVTLEGLPTFDAGSAHWLLPVVSCLPPTTPTFTHDGGTSRTFKMTLVSDDYPDLTDGYLPEHDVDGVPVLLEYDEKVTSFTRETDVKYTLFSAINGNTVAEQQYDFSRPEYSFSRSVTGGSDLLALEQFFHACGGSANAFIKPTWETREVFAGTTITLDVENVDDMDLELGMLFGYAKNVFSDLSLHEVTSLTVAADKTEVTFTPPIVEPTSPEKAIFTHIAMQRFSSDTINLTTVGRTTACSIKTVGVAE